MFLGRLPALLLLAGCATERGGDLLLEDQDREPLRPIAPSPPTTTKDEEKIPETPVKAQSPDEVASALPHDQACVRATTELDKGGDPAGAFALLQACAAQGKWRDLRRTLSPPLKDRLKALPEEDALLLLFQIIANRGGPFESDVPLCQRWRWDLHYLAEALGGDRLPKNAWVVFRTSATEARRDKGQLTLVELIRSSKDAKAAYTESSRVIVAKAPKGMLFPEEGELIVLARLTGAVESNADGYPEIRVNLVALMKPGLIGPDLSQ